MPSSATLALSGLTPTTGHKINGLAAGHTTSTVQLGDFNGDGFVDLAVSAWGANAYAGVTYVINGTASGLPTDVGLDDLDGTNGFRITGPTGRALGSSLAAADVNGDGIQDLLLGGPGNAGHVTVVFGQSGPTAATRAYTVFNGTNGFNIASQGGGYSIASAGDINGDGIEDVILGSPSVNSNAGAAYVLFGKTTGWAGNMSILSLNGTDGFRVDGLSGSNLGTDVEAIDMNGDGIDDLVVGARTAGIGAASAGAVHIVYGKTSGWSASLSVADLDGDNGMTVFTTTATAFFGRDVTNLGDINGDGHDDLGIAASNSLAAYVVFGGDTSGAAQLDVASLDGSSGFRLTLPTVGSRIANVGDINGDGYLDLMATSLAGPGRAFVLFGDADGWSATENLVGLDGVRGFTINGEVTGDLLGRIVQGGQDLNGDGLADIVLEATGQDAAGNGAGAVYIVYGQQGNINRVGTAAAEGLTGNIGNDTLSGLAGQDVLQGLAGDDVLDGGDNADDLYGGDGADDLIGGAGGDVLWGGAGDDQASGGSEGDKLYGEDGADVLNGDAGNDLLYGGAGIDILNGGDGNDTFDGGDGADSLTGGLGNDVYILGAGDTVTEGLDAGYDIVRTDLDGITLAANVEALQLQGTADLDGSGNALSNNLQGNSGANSLYGLAGVDTINGNDGDDVIVGGAGNDLLRGGLGADRFMVLQESIAATLETDQVYDFSTAEGDIIDLSGIDAIAGGADNAFTLVSSFTRAAGEMTLSFAGGITTLRLDVNGDGKVDYQMKITGDVTGDSAGWLL